MTHAIAEVSAAYAELADGTVAFATSPFNLCRSKPRASEVVGSGRWSVGIVGYGRFGRALSDVMTEAGLAVSAFDPATNIPGHHSADSLATLTAEHDTVFLAVPVHAIDSALSELRPFLTPDHLVIDVARAA